ncbi:MAG: DNA-directed RNA polymerase subunit omega [Candidatus Coatesbacteria bacterium]|nr:DNA-directed RNA polymerase subunit omega [Candidatus Coatesbacteria bacterium]
MEGKRTSPAVTELVFEGIAKIDSEYDFTVLSAVRALQIQSGLPPLTRSGSRSCLERAMEEIIEGKIEIKPQDETSLD